MHMVDHLPLIADSTPPTAVLTLLSPKTLTAYSLFKFRMLCIQLNSRLTMFCDPCLTSFTKEQNLLRFKQLLFIHSLRSMGSHKTFVGLIFSCIYHKIINMRKFNYIFNAFFDQKVCKTPLPSR